MGLLRSGSDEVLFLQTEKIILTIKGQDKTRAHFNASEEKLSTLKVFCKENYDLTLCENPCFGSVANSADVYSGLYTTEPIFFEQHHYEIIIESLCDHEVAFYHENMSIRDRVTRVGRSNKIVSGIINFNNEIGFSDLVIQISGENYLRVVIEVFPTKISYKEDYQTIIEDVTDEVYNLVFDFLKKTYLGYQQKNRVNNSPIEFFIIIRKIFNDFLNSVDLILDKPHHVLETIHEVLPAHKIKRSDNQSLRWIEKNPNQIMIVNGKVLVAKASAVKKLVTYNTKENRLTKHILLSVTRKLNHFKRSYMRLQRESDLYIIRELDNMINKLNSRCTLTFLSEIPPLEATMGMSLVFTMAPGYRNLNKFYLMLLRGLEITGDVFHISVKNLAQLYEYWCFIKLNSMLKKHQLVSQDIVRVQGNGLFISLVKGNGSNVKYITDKGETITLSYNPKFTEMPTGSQNPDNVLKLTKLGSHNQYEYIFDAKYRVNPALPGTEYHSYISQNPGPEVDDINTMHRYRDAIVRKKSQNPFERTMFGAYILFPYKNENEFREHKFYKSIQEVNIGGLPFLPSSTSTVSNLLNELIADSPDSAFERTTLPSGIEEKLAKLNWETRDVLVIGLRNRNQLSICLQHGFYHVPVASLKESDFPIRYIALYQSQKLFNADSGIEYFGEVVLYNRVPRHTIQEIPKNSNDQYYRFEIKEWRKLTRKIKVKEVRDWKIHTNLFLLEHSAETPELLIRSEAEYRLYSELKRALNDAEINDRNSIVNFRYQGATIIFDQGYILVIRDDITTTRYSVQDFSRRPNLIFKQLFQDICTNSSEED